jgi:sugar phosphate isomerase/epimerase
VDSDLVGDHRSQDLPSRVRFRAVSGRDEIVGLYWTTSGPVEVHSGREWSLFDLRDRCKQAQRVGMKGIGLWHADLEHVLETRTLGDIQALLDDHGLVYLELECLMDWFLDPDDPRRRASDETRRLLFEAAAALDAHHVKVTNIPGAPCELDTLAERYAELCAEAATQHDARVVYEFMPPDVNVQDLDTALALVDAAGAPANGGLAIDTWHMAKLGIEPAELRRIPAGQLGWVELSDGQWENMPDPVDETVNHRRLPGEGEFPIADYAAACMDAGYDGPWGVEVLSQELRQLPLEQIFDRAYETTAAQLDAARERSAGG